MNVRTKLAIGFSIIVVLLWLIAFFASTGYRNLDQQFVVVEEEIVAETLFITNIEGLASEAYSGALDYMVRGSEEAKLNTLSLLDSLAEVRNANAAPDDDKDQELFTAIDQFHFAISNMIATKDSGAALEDLMVIDEAIGLPALLSLQQAANLQKALNNEELAVAEADFNEAYETGLRFILTGIALVTLIALASAVLTTRSITGPLNKLRKGTEMVARGDLGFKVGTKAGDEIGQLSRAFDRMTEGLTNTMTSVDNLNKEIAERRKVEKALQKSEEKFRVGFEHSRDAIFLADAGTGILLDVNRAGCDLLGMPREKIIGMHQAELYPPEMAEKQKKRYRENRGKGSAFVEDLLVQRADGTRVPVDVSSSLFELDGKPTMQGVFRNITAHKQAEAALRTNEERYRLLLDNSTALIARVQMTPSSKADYVSPSCLRITGYKQEDFYKDPHLLFKMIHPEDRELSRKHMKLAIEKEQKPVTVRLVRKDGEMVWVEQVHEAVANEQGEAVAMHLIVRDITGRIQMENELKVHREHLEELVRERTAELTDLNKRMEHELKERQRAEVALLAAKDEAETASRAKSEFLARTSHEIRTPIHGVMGTINLVLDSELEHDQRQYLKMAISSAEALLNIIDDILDLSKIEAGLLEPEHEGFNLRTTLEDTLDSMAVTACNKGLELTCHLSGGVATDLIGDAGHLRQVLVNLVGNAIKFTEKGEVALYVEPVTDSKKETELHFTVRDTGIGIPDSKFDMIFEPFQQADGSINRKYGGTGLGLTISRHLIDKMGGRIWVENGPRKGSIFHFTGKFDKQTNGRRSGNGSKNILEVRDVPLLLVDDNATNRSMVKDILAGWGFDVTDVASGPAALKVMAGAGPAPYRVIMLDKTMDGMDGFAVAERMLNDSAAPPDIIMMLPSHSVSDDFSRCQKLGISNYIIKPIRESELRKALLAALGKTPEPEKKKGRPTRKAANMPSLHILVAEDNPTSRLIARETLERIGHHVAIAQNGSEAVSMAEEGDYDLILMDAEMPVLNGLEATRLIRKHENAAGRHVPIVAMTAYAMKADKIRCLEAGMDGYLSKPAKPEEINAVVAGLFAGKKKPGGVSKSSPGVRQDGQPAVDIEAARQVLGGDDTLLREAVALFLAEDYPKQLELLREGIECRDAAAVRAAAHSLKGAARGLGGTALGDVALQIEELGREGGLEGARELAGRLEDEFKRFADYYSQLAEI